jgi:hypothetical protein
VAFIGVATGLTVSASLDFSVERVVAIELIPGVADVVSKFAAWNRNVFDDPRVELVVEDGRHHLLGTTEKFDVIISDLFVPWHAGTGDLYSTEHFQTCRERIADGGLFAQWLPGYQLTVEEFRTIAASLLQVFPRVSLWRSDMNAQTPIVCLIGHRDPQSDLVAEATREHCRRIASIAQPSATFLSSADGVELLFVAGDVDLRRWTKGAALNTDDHPIIEFTTPKSAFRHRQRDIGPMLDLLASFRPSAWPYSERIATKPVESIRAAISLLHDAQVANSQGNYVKEYRSLSRLVDVAGDLPVVADIVVEAAGRFRQRQQVDRCDELLTALVEKSDRTLTPSINAGSSEARKWRGCPRRRAFGAGSAACPKSTRYSSFVGRLAVRKRNVCRKRGAPKKTR